MDGRHEVLHAFEVGSRVESAAPAGVSGRLPAFGARRSERAGLGDQVPGRVHLLLDVPREDPGEHKKVGGIKQALVVGFHPRRYNQRRTRALY